jgi:hypothetical protein
LTDQPGVTASVHLPGVLIAPLEGYNEPLVEATPAPKASAPAITYFQTPQIAPAAQSAAPLLIGTANGRNGSNQHGRIGLPRRSPGASGVNDATAYKPVVALKATPEPDEPDTRAANTYSYFAGAHSNSNGNSNGNGNGNVVTEAQDRIPDPPPIDQEPAGEVSPIYQRMTSEWLIDPAAHGHNRHREWASTPADDGWNAAQRASETKATDHTESGLPIRERGARLVPGQAMWGPADEPVSRDPAIVQATLTRQLAGVRNGRARIEGTHSREGDR